MEPRKTTRSRWRVGILVAALLLGAAMAPVADAQTAVRIGYLPLLYYNAWYWAEQQRWWGETGLKPQFKTFATGQPQIQAFGAGELDIGSLGTVPLLLGTSKGLVNLQAIGIMGNVDNAFGIFVPGASPIKTVPDLRGKTVALPLGTNWQLVFDSALRKHGMSQKDVKVLNMAPADVAAALLAGRIDAGLPHISQFYELETKHGFRSIFMGADMAKGPTPVNIHMYDVIVVDAEYGRRNPGTVTKVLGLWFRVMDHWHRNFDTMNRWNEEYQSRMTGTPITPPFTDYYWAHLSKETLESNLRAFDRNTPDNIWAALDGTAKFYGYAVDVDAIVNDSFLKALARR
jgi:ABC-type nitrate/sulfonate/bicarbonate transport system substrate-binding protein